jgi:hypothetical protein
MAAPTNALGRVRRPPRVRYLIDIVALVAVTFLLDIAVSAFVQASVSIRATFVFDALGKLVLIAIGWGLIRLRGEVLQNQNKVLILLRRSCLRIEAAYEKAPIRRAGWYRFCRKRACRHSGSAGE